MPSRRLHWRALAALGALLLVILVWPFTCASAVPIPLKISATTSSHNFTDNNVNSKKINVSELVNTTTSIHPSSLTQFLSVLNNRTHNNNNNSSYSYDKSNNNNTSEAFLPNESNDNYYLNNNKEISNTSKNHMFINSEKYKIRDHRSANIPRRGIPRLRKNRKKMQFITERYYLESVIASSEKSVTSEKSLNYYQWSTIEYSSDEFSMELTTSANTFTQQNRQSFAYVTQPQQQQQLYPNASFSENSEHIFPNKSIKFDNSMLFEKNVKSPKAVHTNNGPNRRQRKKVNGSSGEENVKDTHNKFNSRIDSSITTTTTTITNATTGSSISNRRKQSTNLDRNERSANLSHIMGTAARKIQLLIKNRLLQILPDGTVNGTQDDTSDNSEFCFFIFYLLSLIFHYTKLLYKKKGTKRCLFLFCFWLLFFMSEVKIFHFLLTACKFCRETNSVNVCLTFTIAFFLQILVNII